MSYYSEDVIDDIRSGNDIVDVVGEYVKLRRSGSSYVGLCPFHNEKTPSFHVHQDGQYYHCFGCGAGGNVIGFIMECENLSFADALKFLADRINYTLPEVSFSKNAQQKKELKQKLYDIHKIAARFYYDCLMSSDGKNAVEYLDKRDVTLGARRKFGLGYSPIARGALYNRLKEKGFDDDTIIKSGLAYKRNDGTFYDKFFNRLMFPIIDVYGNIIGFGGRILGDGQPKYLNSPETDIFNKSRNLYNLNLAKQARMRELILVEGYMDAIAIYQAGFKNVVASLGTAFNENHARVMKAYADSVILLFDSDEAGVKAVLRAIPVLTGAGLRVKVLQVTDAKDPDEFIKKFGAAAFGELLNNAKSHILFRAEQIQKKYNLDNLEERIDFSKDIARLMSEVSSSIEADAYLKEVSRITNIDLSAIQSEINKLNNGITVINNINNRRNTNKKGIDGAREDIINIVMSDKRYYDIISRYLEPKELLDPFYIKILEIIYSLYRNNKEVNTGTVLNCIETPDEQSKFTAIFVKRIKFDSSEIIKAINDIVKTIKTAYYDKLISDDYTNPNLSQLIESKRKVNNLYISLSDG